MRFAALLAALFCATLVPASAQPDLSTLPGLERPIKLKPKKKPGERRRPPGRKRRTKKRPRKAPRSPAKKRRPAKKARPARRVRRVPKRAPADRYTFISPPGWTGPEKLPAGVRFREPTGLGLITISFHETGSEHWDEPVELRRRMRELGATDDSHALDTVMISGRFASRARFTTYHYTGSELGERSAAFYTEMLMIPDPDGVYMIHYRAFAGDFRRLRSVYISFLKSLKLPKRRMAVEKYYRERDHILEDVMELDVLPPIITRPKPPPPRKKRFEAGLMIGIPGGGGLYAMYIFKDRWSAGLVYGGVGLGINLPPNDFSDASLSRLGFRGRWHWTGAFKNGPYLYGELGRLKASFDEPAGTDSAFLPTVGLGYRILYDHNFWDFGLGIMPPKTFETSAEDGTAASAKLMHTLHVAGGLRF